MSLKQIARQTLELLDSGRYVAPSGTTRSINEAQSAAVAETCVYSPKQLDELLSVRTTGASADISVVDETTQAAAFRLSNIIDDQVLLNFASARNPGGGFLNGASAQEEELCRCSGLFRCIAPQDTYYAANRAECSALYTDHVIYSPNVPFFKIAGRGEFLEQPFSASVITAPAPNAGAILNKDPDAGHAIAETFVRRWGLVLSVARDRGHRNLILGAWGCGAFQNDPKVAAEAFVHWLADGRFSGSFDRLLFAIPGKGRRSRQNLEAFRRALAHDS